MPNGDGSGSAVPAKAVRHGILFLPGESSFYGKRRTACVRVSFSILNDEEMDEALRRLADVLIEEWNEFRNNPLPSRGGG